MREQKPAERFPGGKMIKVREEKRKEKEGCNEVVGTKRR